MGQRGKGKDKREALVGLERLPNQYDKLDFMSFRQEVAKLSGMSGPYAVSAKYCTHPDAVSLYRAEVIDKDMNVWMYLFFPTTVDGRQCFGIGRKIIRSSEEGSSLDAIGKISYGKLSHNPFAAVLSSREARGFTAQLPGARA